MQERTCPDLHSEGQKQDWRIVTYSCVSSPDSGSIREVVCLGVWAGGGLRPGNTSSGLLPSSSLCHLFIFSSLQKESLYLPQWQTELCLASLGTEDVRGCARLPPVFVLCLLRCRAQVQRDLWGFMVG